MKMIYGVIAAAIGCASASGVDAKTVTYSFTGKTDRVQTDIKGVTNSFQGYVTYNTDAPARQPNDIPNYTPPFPEYVSPTSIHLESGKISVTLSADLGTIRVINDYSGSTQFSPGDHVSLAPGVFSSVSEIDKYRTINNAVLSLDDDTGAALSSSALPQTLNLGDFSTAEIRLYGTDESKAYMGITEYIGFHGSLTSLRLSNGEATPAPGAPAWAFMIGGVGVIGGAMRRRRAVRFA